MAKKTRESVLAAHVKSTTSAVISNSRRSATAGRYENRIPEFADQQLTSTRELKLALLDGPTQYCAGSLKRARLFGKRYQLITRGVSTELRVDLVDPLPSDVGFAEDGYGHQHRGPQPFNVRQGPAMARNDSARHAGRTPVLADYMGSNR